MLDDKGLDLIFRKARSQNGWAEAPVSDDMLKALYEVWKWGPTSANCSPARILFIRSQAGKERLRPHLMPANVEKTMTAPVCAIIGYHKKFYERIPELFPHNPQAQDWFSNNQAFAEETAFRNSSLQGAYLLIAARAMGLDAGPMSGFDADAVEAEFFPSGDIKVNFICALGKGDDSKLFDRHPRLSFDEACQLL